MSQYDHAPRPEDAFLTRRQLLHRCGMGMGAVALANLVGKAGLVAEAQQSINPLAPKRS